MRYLVRVRKQLSFLPPAFLRLPAMADYGNVTLAEEAGFHFFYFSPTEREMFLIAPGADMAAFSGHPDFVTPAANVKATRTVSNIMQEWLPC